MLEDLKARQYYDFTRISDDTSDSFFEQTLQNTLSDNEDGLLFYTPMGVRNNNIRRSLSEGDLHLQDENKADDQERSKLNKCQLTKPGSTGTLNKLTNNNNLIISKKTINRLAQPKKAVAGSNNFVGLAEAGILFQKDVGVRNNHIKQQIDINSEKIKPQSPKLLSKNRTRPITVLSQEDQEKIEMEEAQKFKIKARPVNPKVLQPPKKPVVFKKPTTVPQPFKLTEICKKIIENPPQESNIQFHAKPVPKTIYEPLVVKPALTAITVPVTPQCLKKYPQKNKNVNPVATTTTVTNFKPTRTQPIPFSFDKRDEQLKVKKEEFVKKVSLEPQVDWLVIAKLQTIEKEKKARQFHANPLPKCIKHSNSTGSLSSKSTTKTSTESLNPPPITFKARPATVLKMKPFEPVKIPHNIQTEEFHLSVERRLNKRHEFDLRMKEKEQKLLEEQLELEAYRRQIEEEERMELRKQATIKAQPIRKYQPIEIKYNHQPTEPISPNFHYKQRNKENVQCN